ncbi:MAG: hypothetical protein MJ239_00470 [Bacilli bacterium]|nr:hypothetical protein [Bacilli bacterium]
MGDVPGVCIGGLHGLPHYSIGEFFEKGAKKLRKSKKYTYNLFMSFFKERKTPIENIAFMGLMCAVNAVFSLIATLLPVGAVFIMLVVPLGSALVAKLCKAKYLPIYLFAAIGVSIAITAWDFSTTIFYTFPAICSGLLFGFLKRRDVPTALCVLGVTLVQIGFTYLSLPIVKAIYGIDMVFSIEKAFGVETHPYISDIVPSFIIAYAMAQSAISSLFMTAGLFEDKEKEIGKLQFIYPALDILISIISAALIICGVRNVGYALLCFAIYFSCISLFGIFTKINVTSLVIGGALVVISIFVFAIINPSLSPWQKPALFLMYCVSMAISYIANLLFLYKKGNSSLK